MNIKLFKRKIGLKRFQMLSFIKIKALAIKSS